MAEQVRKALLGAMNVTAVCGARCAQEWRGKDVPKVLGRSLTSVPQEGGGSRGNQLSEVSPFFFLEDLPFFLGELCKCFLPLLQFRSQKGALQPAVQAWTALSLQDLRYGQQDPKKLSVLLFKHAKSGIPFVPFISLFEEAQARQTCRAC